MYQEWKFPVIIRSQFIKQHPRFDVSVLVFRNFDSYNETPTSYTSQKEKKTLRIEMLTNQTSPYLRIRQGKTQLNFKLRSFCQSKSRFKRQLCV